MCRHSSDQRGTAGYSHTGLRTAQTGIQMTELPQLSYDATDLIRTVTHIVGSGRLALEHVDGRNLFQGGGQAVRKDGNQEQRCWRSLVRKKRKTMRKLWRSFVC